MKTKYFFLAALAATALASCTSDDLIAEAPPFVNEEAQLPIMFSSMNKGLTRADITGASAANLLGGQFVVSGYKGTATASLGSIVFDNYAVRYHENTAHTTESNTANWEYVGEARIPHAITNGVTQQTIKYWDYSKDQYDFIAWSTGQKTAIYERPTTGGIPAGSILVSAITPANATTTAYTFEGAAADLEGCYVADLVTVKKADYGNTVTLKFRSLGSKVRIGIYETVPGYSVRDVKFYSTAGLLTDPATEIVATPTLFTKTANNIYTQGVYTVYYPTVDDPSKADNNQAHISFAGTGTQSTVVNFGNLNYTIAEDGEKTPGAVYLGRTSNTATMAGEAEGNYYTQYLPNEAGTNLNLRVDYVLESIDGSGETIEVKNATAQVPLIYTQWKAGFAYTYLFKISDKTNGRTGVYDPTQADDATVNSDPAGLYPITFDALVVDADEDLTQETITLVSTPSITTYQKGSTVINDNEYQAPTAANKRGDIYVTVNESDALVTLTTTGTTPNAALYTLPTTPTRNYTEADVVDALAMQDDDAAANTIKGRSGLVLTNATLTPVKEVQYGVDGNVIPADGTNNKAAKFTPTAGNTYAFVYTKTAATTTTDKFQPVTKADGATVDGLYRYALTAAAAGDVQKGVKYFENDDASTGMITPFLGQGVSNLYLDYTGTTIASGYAVTGTTYYYTTDNGMSYKAAHNVEYKATGWLSGLYEKSGNDYVATTDTEPANGKAYYYKDGTDYIYCVFLPQQTTGLYVINETVAKVACGNGDTAVSGMTYFDKYTQNNGVYYVKIIKVQ